MYYIYKLTVPVNDINKIYIGSSKNIPNRISKHNYYCYNKNHRNYCIKLYKYIRENQIDFKDLNLEIIDEITKDEISEDVIICCNKYGTTPAEVVKLEQYYIDLFNSIKDGLNCINAYISDEQKKENKRIKHLERYWSNPQYYRNKNKESKIKNAEYVKKYNHEYKTNQKNKDRRNEKNRNTKKQCPICYKYISGADNGNLKRHLKTHENIKKTINPQIKCIYCNDMLIQSSMSNHYRKKHPEIDTKCSVITKNGKRCSHNKTQNGICTQHNNARKPKETSTLPLCRYIGSINKKQCNYHVKEEGQLCANLFYR